MNSLQVLFCSLCIVAVIGATMNDMQRHETEVTSFDVKPGAGRQEYTKQWVSHAHSVLNAKLVMHFSVLVYYMGAQ